jgi:hypothetical protein
MSYAVASFAIWLSKTILAMCSNAKKPSSFGKVRAEIPIEVGTVISWGASQTALRYLTSATASAGANSVKYWEIIADNLSKAEWSWGCVSAIDSNGRTIWIADTHRDDGKRFVVHGEEKLTAFAELESAIRHCGELA